MDVRQTLFFFLLLHHIACLPVCSTSVVSMLEELRRLACSFAVPLMVVNGAKLLELAARDRVETKPTPQVCRNNAQIGCICIYVRMYVCTYVRTCLFIIYNSKWRPANICPIDQPLLCVLATHCHCILATCCSPLCQELISCLVNADEVQSIVSTPGRRYKGVGGVEVAAARIQATFRMHRARKQYMELRRRKWAGSVIAMGWLLHLQARRTRLRLRERRAEERAGFLRRAQELKKTWSRIKAERHVVVHLPSLGA